MAALQRLPTSLLLAWPLLLGVGLVADAAIPAASPPPVILTAVQDSFVTTDDKNLNEGANPRLRIEKQNRVLMVFDLTGITPASVTSARLVLTIAGAASNKWSVVGRFVNARPLLADFTEGNGSLAGLARAEATRGSGPGVTWNCATDAEIANRKTDCGEKWNGGSFGPATAASVLHTNGLTGEVEWDVTADVRAGAARWVIQKRKEHHSGEVQYYSREGSLDAFGDLSRAPRLIIIE